jgi:predicted CXXCH cytochrome family protein
MVTLQSHRSRITVLMRLVSVAAVGVAVAMMQAMCTPNEVQAKQAEFIDRQGCKECHEEQYTEWAGSHHDLAMDVAIEETVLGDFNGTTFTNYGLTTTFYKRDEKFFVRTDGPDGELRDYEISYVLGIDPLQQYMIKFPDGRIQVLDIGWDTHPKEEGGQRWFHIHPDEEITPKHIFHWTRRFLNWNYMCAECHTTNLQKNFDMETNTFKTTWSEIDVSCQACHGPGSNHVEWARRIEQTKEKWDKDDKKGLEVQFKGSDSHVQVEACARCHSRRNIINDGYQYGRRFMDYYSPQLLLEDLYHADGQILDEVYVYGSFIQSRKYHQGVRCTDCHNPHTLRLRSPGNGVCLQCHNEQASKSQFPTLQTKDYDSPEHHFHKIDSAGAGCVNCHMPAKNYMVVDPRHDHSFRIPRPDLTVKLGIPNSCNECHKEKTAHWSAHKMEEWYPLTKDKRKNETHFAEIITAGRLGISSAEPKLIKLASDRDQPAIIRATALHLLSRYGSKNTLDLMVESLRDANPMVRVTAVAGFSIPNPSALNPELHRKKLAWLAPLLKDPIRAVRVETARVLTEVPADLFDQPQRKAFVAALEEYKQRQYAIIDRPEAHLNLGIMYRNLGQNNLAETSYKNAIRLVSDFIPARFNLANLYNAMGRNKEAERQFRQIIELEPNNGEAYYSLGLLQAEMKRLDESAEHLAKAAELLPDQARVRYNYALALQHLGRSAEVEIVMVKAHQLELYDPEIVYAVVVMYMQQNRWEKAFIYAQKLIKILPDAPGPRQLLQQIQEKLSNGDSSR